MTQHSYKVNVAELAADPTLGSSDGWVNMAVQFLVDHSNGGARKVVFGRTVFAPGESVHQLHRHPGAEEVVYLVRGRGVATNGDEEIVLEVGDIAFHPQGEWHGFYNTSADRGGRDDLGLGRGELEAGRRLRGEGLSRLLDAAATRHCSGCRPTRRPGDCSSAVYFPLDPPCSETYHTEHRR